MGRNIPIKGLVRLSGPQADSTVLQSLASQDAVALIDTHANQPNPFLLKRFRSIGWIELAPLNISLMMMIGMSGLNAAEVEVAIEDTKTGDIEDQTNWDSYHRENRLIWNTIFSVQGGPGRIDNDPVTWDTGWMTAGAKGVGIPFPEAFGPQIIAYNNHGDALPVDVLNGGYTIFEGVYLRD